MIPSESRPKEDIKALVNSQYPVYSISPSDEKKFQDEIKTVVFEEVEIGLYLDGKIDVGNLEDIPYLNPENGELISLECEEVTLKKSILKLVSVIFSALF